ncbi:MAG: tetratricopeptide repeat protein [Casimicrobium sp.]
MTLFHTFAAEKPLRVAVTVALLAFSMGAAAQTTAQNGDLQEINRMLKAGQSQQALDRVNVYLTSKPKDAVGRFIRGLAQAELGKTNDAIATFQSLTEDYPELPEPYNNLAVLYSSKGQFEKARVALELAIQTHPTYSTAHENLGDIYAKLASQAYDKALQLDKGNGTVATKLNLVRDLFSTNPKANTAPRPVASATTLVAASAVPPATRPAPVVPPVAAAAVAPKAVAVPAPVVATKVEPPKAAPAPVAAADGSAEVLRAVNKWAAEWSGKDADGYLSAYSKSFKPEGGVSYRKWSATRRERVAAQKDIKVEVLGAIVEMKSATEAKVTFRQAYNSQTLQTRSRKTLTLVKEGSAWLITREHVG